MQGDPYELGSNTDPWGARFVNVEKGAMGQVKEPLICGEEWEDAGKAHIPYELLTFDRESINQQCAESNRFMIARTNPHPFEQLQFLRGTENLYCDLVTKPAAMFSFIEKMHDFYCKEVEAWAQTDIDGIVWTDDWGSQNSLLINPETWVEIFKPLYRDYINIAKRYGKKTLMHSDGNISSIIPHMIDLGLDALNCQLFVMGLDSVKKYRGQITFWSEIDQHLLSFATPAEVKSAVREVYDALWADGGCLAQCSFWVGNRPENIRAAFEAWDQITK